jgi:hypothetical protein
MLKLTCRDGSSVTINSLTIVMFEPEAGDFDPDGPTRVYLITGAQLSVCEPPDEVAAKLKATGVVIC